ncbi:MAG UNVERIFIED_CONTAM: hypothetical protein LVT10_00970 [Anaerolineae bacterium]
MAVGIALIVAPLGGVALWIGWGLVVLFGTHLGTRPLEAGIAWVYRACGWVESLVRRALFIPALQRFSYWVTCLMVLVGVGWGVSRLEAFAWGNSAESEEQAMFTLTEFPEVTRLSLRDPIRSCGGVDATQTSMRFPFNRWARRVGLTSAWGLAQSVTF